MPRYMQFKRMILKKICSIWSCINLVLLCNYLCQYECYECVWVGGCVCVWGGGGGEEGVIVFKVFVNNRNWIFLKLQMILFISVNFIKIYSTFMIQLLTHWAIKVSFCFSFFKSVTYHFKTVESNIFCEWLLLL